MIGGFQVGAFQPAYQQVPIAVEQGGGGYFDTPEYGRRRSREEIQQERERLGILPKAVRKVVRKLVEKKVEEVQTVEDGRELLAALAESELRQALRAEQVRYQANYTAVMMAVIRDAIRRRMDEIEETEANEVLALWLDM